MLTYSTTGNNSTENDDDDFDLCEVDFVTMPQDMLEAKISTLACRQAELALAIRGNDGSSFDEFMELLGNSEKLEKILPHISLRRVIIGGPEKSEVLTNGWLQQRAF